MRRYLTGPRCRATLTDAWFEDDSLNRLRSILVVVFLSLNLLPSFAQDSPIGDVIDKYTSSKAPFPLVGEWTLLIPKSEKSFSSPLPPIRFIDSFQVFYIRLYSDGRATLGAPGQQRPEYYTWEHALSGPRFYIRLTDQVVLRFMYFVSLGYVRDDPNVDTWTLLQTAWHVGLAQTELGALSYESMLGNDSPKPRARIAELHKDQKPICEAAIPLIMSTLVSGVAQGNVHAVITRRDGIK